jgi:hypothetical protein
MSDPRYKFRVGQSERRESKASMWSFERTVELCTTKNVPKL